MRRTKDLKSGNRVKWDTLQDSDMHVVSADDVELAKPRAEVYRHAVNVAGIDPKELALIAAHSWDIHGAAAAGLVTAYLDAEQPYSSAMRSPAMEGGTLADLAQPITAL